MKLIFYDVDTQNDFMNKNSRLYVPNAEIIKPNLKFLNWMARELAWRTHDRDVPGILGLYKVKKIGSEDYHSLADPEISDAPDYITTFPPHCIAGTRGQKRIEETKPLSPYYLNVTGARSNGKRWRDSYIKSDVALLNQDFIFRKQFTDIKEHKYADMVFDELKPDVAIVYGVAIEYCVDGAVMYLNNKGIDVLVVEDAIKGIDPVKEKQVKEKWQDLGIKLITTGQLRETEKTSDLVKLLEGKDEKIQRACYREV